MPSVADDSEAGIANLALSLAQSSSQISSLDQPNSKAARTCKRWYPVVRDELLRSYFWNFATDWIAIAEVLPAPTGGKFLKAFEIPEDCLRVLEVANIAKADWTVGKDKRLLCNGTAPLDVRGILRIDAIGRWDALFKSMFAHQLAIRVAPELSRHRGIVKDLKPLFDELRMQARTIDSYEKEQDNNEPDYVSEYIAVRA